MNAEAKRAIEAILMVADQPIEANLLAQITEVPVARVDEICAELHAEYEAAERGFLIAKVAGGYRFQSHPDLAPYVERFVLDGQSAKMSAAALETLAIVAYKQPISRAQLASIRGVNADGVMRTLEARGYVHEVGRDPGPGNAVMYGTTPAFLEKLGLNSVDQLPPLGAFVPGADVVEQLERTLRVEPVQPDDAVDDAGDTTEHENLATEDFAADDVVDDVADDLVDDVVVDIRSNGAPTVDLVAAESAEPAIDLDLDDADADAGERQPGES